jgi:subtilisin family serine protease
MASLLVGQIEGGFNGLAPRAGLLCARVIGAGREATLDAVERAIRWAVEHGADVIVLPFGAARGTPRLGRVIRWAARGGSILLAAAGTRGPETQCFPARLDEVLAVTGTDAEGRPLPRCCAPGLADLAAPGQAIPAMGPDGPATLHGSSPAVVLAAGVAALERAAAGRRDGRTPLPGARVPPSYVNADAAEAPQGA